MSGNVHHATLVGSRDLATDVVEYRLRLSEADAQLAWRPGQFISVNCGDDADGNPILRSYSIANRPGAGELLLVLKLIAGGPASEWFKSLTEGAPVRFTGPMGFFVLELLHPGDLVFVATGTGIAPLVPMIEESLARPAEAGRVHLLWGLREERDLFWQEALAALSGNPRFRYAIHLTRPSEGWTGKTGRVTGPALDLLGGLEKPTFYLCGNGAMIRELKAALVERGCDRKRQIRTEAFFD